MSRILLLDNGYFIHKAIFSWKANKSIPSTYKYLSMILGDLKKVGVTKEDTVIIAEDKGRSWRKELDKEYKHTRKKKRQKHTDIPWSDHYNAFNKLMVTLAGYSPFHVVGEWGCEADDIISYVVRHYKDKECIILSVDKDFEQLFSFPNVRIYSPRTKKYKEPLKDPYKSLLGKIEREASDDLVSPLLTKKDREIRETIVSLLKLPEEIEKKIKPKVEFFPEKEIEISMIPYNTIQKRLETLYDGSKAIKYPYKKEVENGTVSKKTTGTSKGSK